MFVVGLTSLLLLMSTSIKTGFTEEYKFYDNFKANDCRINKNEIGKCVSLTSCPTILINYFSNKPIPVCYYFFFEPYVCCPVSSKIVTPNIPELQPFQNFPTFAPPTFSTLPPIESTTPTTPFETPVPTLPPIQSSTNSPFETTTQPSIITGPSDLPIIHTTQLPPIIGQKTSFLKSEEKCTEYKQYNNEVKRQINLFVIGGQESLMKEFPYMAALGFGEQNNIEWLCGGTLISENYVLTAAHCTSTSNLGEVKWVTLGDVSTKSTTNAYSQTFTVAEKITHPEYSRPILYNDIALLKLDRPAIFSNYVRPVCLYTSENYLDGKFIAAGWGRTQANGDVSDDLLKVLLDYFPNIVCRQTYYLISSNQLPRGIDDASQVCAGSADGQRDTCQGDSGGPLMILGADRENYLVGITSFGRECGVPNTPGVYTKVYNYIEWIENIVWPN